MTRLFDVLPRRVALVALATGVISLVAACDAAAPVTLPTPHPTATLPPPTSLNNRNLAIREIRRLIVLPNLPPARSPMFTAPENLHQPVSVPGGSSLVHVHRFWRVGIDIEDARRWVAQHPPVGLRPNGTSSRAMFGSAKVYSFRYSDQDSAAWTGANLQIAIVAAGRSSTFWRVDAMALWLDARPARVPAGGRRLTVTVRSGCPGADHGAVSVRPSGLHHRLLPAGTPTEAVVCHYSGAGALTSHSALPAAAAAQLADLAARVGFEHVDGRTIHCPMDNGSHLAIAFRYPDGHHGALWYRASGCPAVDNGTVFAGVGPGSHALFAALAKLR